MSDPSSDQFNFKIKSIIMGIGPIKCGKTYLLKNIIMPQLKSEIEITGHQPNIKYLSSEEIRRWLLNDITGELSSRDPRMISASGSAFNILETQLREIILPKYDTHFVIIDTTGMNKDFQNKMLSIATEYGYNLYFLVFDFKNRSDYYKYCPDKSAVSRSIMKFKKDVLGFIPHHRISHKYLVKNLDKKVIMVDNMTNYFDHFLDVSHRYLVLGNLSYQEAIDTILSVGFSLDDRRIVHSERTHNMEIIISFNSDVELFCALAELNRDIIRTLTPKSWDYYIYHPKKKDAYFMVDGKTKESFIGGYQMSKLKYIKRKSAPETVKFEDLDDEKKVRISKLIKHQVNYISGTISPANKNGEILEDPLQGLEYYYKFANLIKSVSVQVKYMGSRFQFYYFHQQPEKCYGTTRNGFVSFISRDIIQKIYEKLSLKMDGFIKKYNVKTIIFDGEILPWSLLGVGLINHEFKSVGEAADLELSFLQQTGFFESQEKILKDYQETGFRADLSLLNPTKLNKKYPNYQTLKTITKYQKTYLPHDKIRLGIDTFKEQMEIFGKEGDPEYKPFGILKIIAESKRGEDMEYIPGVIHPEIKKCTIHPELSNMTQSDIFNLISDKEDQIEISFELSREECFSKLMKFYEHTTKNRKLEGIVIKPAMMSPDYAPMIKARGSDYLHIIYGMDYLTEIKYKKILNNKSIRRKLEVSIEEFKLGLDMLLTPMSAINSTNREYVNNLINYLYLEDSEKNLDAAL